MPLPAAKPFTPKQVAEAMQVSESSVKRWCDQGLIATERTAGKHRRIPVPAVLSFLRQSRQRLVHPEALGLSGDVGQTPPSLGTAKDSLRDALVAGDERAAWTLAIDLYLADLPLAELCDNVIAAAFREIGDLWSCGNVEVYQERRGCEICARLLHELAGLTPAPAADAPLALGGTVSHDHYSLPTLMVEIVLRDLGWRAASLGTGLPFDTLRAAIEEHRPALFWLSVSHVQQEQKFVRELKEFLAACRGLTTVVLGGRAFLDPLRRRIDGRFCETLGDLARIAGELWNPKPRRKRQGC